jgi:hypothetical protein
MNVRVIDLIPPAFWDGMLCGIFFGVLIGILIATAVYRYAESHIGKGEG